MCKDFRIRMEDVNRCDSTFDFQLDDVNHYEWKYRDRDLCVNFMRALSISFLATIRPFFVDFGKNSKGSTFSNFISLIEVEVTPLYLIVSSFFLGLMTIEISISINQLLL